MGDHRKHTQKPRPWSEEEHSRLVQMQKDGVPTKEICRALGRAQSSVSGRLKNTDIHGNFISRRDRVPLAQMGIDDELLEMHRLGMSQEKIGYSVGLKATAIGARIRFLLAKTGEATAENPQRKHRKCLYCGKSFVSDGPQNRRCSRCQRSVERSEVFTDEWRIMA